MLPPEIVPFLQSGLSTLVGTCDEALRPVCLRAIGLIVLDQGRSARIFLPEATAAPTLRNLREHPQVAVTLSRPATHRTVQLKGRVLNVTRAPEEDRGPLEALFCGFLRETSFLGLPPAVTVRMARWPAYRVDFSVDRVFVQTPGPRAGTTLEPGDLT